MLPAKIAFFIETANDRISLSVLLSGTPGSSVRYAQWKYSSDIPFRKRRYWYSFRSRVHPFWQPWLSHGGLLPLYLAGAVPTGKLWQPRTAWRKSFASRRTSPATDAGCGIHGFLCLGVRNRDGIAIRHTAGVYGYIPACLKNLVVSLAVHNQVLDDRECPASPRLDGDGRSVFETAHVQLACRNIIVRTVGTSVDEETACSANAFAAIVVECHRFLVLRYQFFIQDIEHFQK